MFIYPINEVYFDNTLANVKYNETHKTLPPICMKVYSFWWESHDK